MIPKYSVKRPYTVLVAVVLVIVLGVVSLTRMTTDLLPAMNLPYVIVVTTDVGASPEEVEKDVTSPIEAAMATTSNINNVSSMSYDNYSMVVLEYEQSTNMDSAMIEIQQQLDQLTGQFPDSVGTPIIMQIDPDMMPVMIASADVDGMDQAEVSDYVDNELLPLLESIEGVASVTATGVLDTDLQVTMNQEKIDALNEQILSKIDAQFTDAQAELDKASSKINSGKKKLSDGEKEMGSQLGAGENEIINNKIQLFNTEADLTTQLSDLQKSQSSMDGAIKSLQSAYDGATQLQSAIDGLQKAKDGVSQAKSGAKQLYAMKPQLQQLAASVPAWGGTLPTDYNTFITTLESTVNYMKTLTDPVKQAQAAQMEQMLTGLKSSMTPEIYKALVASASETDFVAYMESTAIAQINAQAGTSYTSESDIASQIVTLQSKLDDINVMLMNQASSFADAGVTLTSYKDIPAAISKLSESKTQIATGIATIESAQTQVADGKTSLDDALVTLNESQIAGIMEMSKGYADLAVAANKIEEGQSQLDDVKEQSKDSADLNTILTMDTLKNLLTAQNFSMPAGYVTEGNEQYLVRVGDEVTSKADLENLVLMDLGMDGIEPIRLSDVADIEYIDNSGDSYSKVNGNPAVMLSIEKQTGYIHGFEADIKTVEAHPQIADGFCGMEIMGKAYTEKADAGEILLAACKDTKSADPVPLGSYRGFQMELSFDSFRNEFDVTLKGAVSHRVALGTDARGNITRLDNALAGILERLERANEQLNNLYNQQEAAKAEVGKPFPQEAELTAKSQRLAELDAALNMEDSVENRDERSESERPSVLADLKSKAEHIPPAKYSETREEVL